MSCERMRTGRCACTTTRQLPCRSTPSCRARTWSFGPSTTRSAARRFCCAASSRTSSGATPRTRWRSCGSFCWNSSSQGELILLSSVLPKEVPMSMIRHCCGCMGRASVALGLAIASAVALAGGVSVKIDTASPDKGPFPSDRFTRLDFSQNTFLRVRLPKPDCNARPSDCADIDVLNTLDGFNVQPRITVPFTGAIDVNTVDGETVFLINLGDTLSGDGFGQRVGINQVSWDAGTNTLVFESDEQLNEHTRYVLVVTDGVRDAAGDPIEAGRWDRFDDPDDRDARRHVPPARHRIAALSVFTTQSTTADLDKIRDQIKRSEPAPAEFVVGQSQSGAVRAVFPLAEVLGIQFSRQVGTAPVFATSLLPTPALNVVPGSVAQIAFGKFRSPDYQTAEKFIP